MERRKFLVGAASATATLTLGELVSGCNSCNGPRERRVEPPPPVEPEPPLEFFTPQQAPTARALFDALIPSNDPPGSPGASEARVIVYVDRALREPIFERLRGLVRAGLGDLERYTALNHQQSFADAPLAVRQEVLTKFQTGMTSGLRVPTPVFFQLVSGLALEGFWGSPTHGGNYRSVSWNWAEIVVTCH